MHIHRRYRPYRQYSSTVVVVIHEAATAAAAAAITNFCSANAASLIMLCRTVTMETPNFLPNLFLLFSLPDGFFVRYKKDRRRERKEKKNRRYIGNAVCSLFLSSIVVGKKKKKKKISCHPIAPVFGFDR